jgi:glycosyltransferase 2 family protein
MSKQVSAKTRIKKWSLFTLRWGIAVVGIWYVVRNISLHDTVWVQDSVSKRPVSARVVGPIDDSQATFNILIPDGSGRVVTLKRTELLSRSADVGEKIEIVDADQNRSTVEVLALHVTDDPLPGKWPVLVGPPRTVVQKYFNSTPPGNVFTIDSAQIVKRKADMPYPLVDIGMKRIVAQADGKYLILAVLVFPLIFVLASVRWAILIRILGIQIRLARTFALTMVGLFYNNFMPGSTGGDLIKAYYASKNTPKRTQVILSVVIDRVIGLLALILLGGTMSAIHWEIPQCRKIAIASAAIIGLTIVGLTVYYVPALRRITGLDFILRKMPMQKQVRSAMEALDLYGQRPGLMLGTLMLSIPVHIIVVISAMCAGKAFGLPLEAKYYWVVVPVVVLSGAIPISPQGAGVMEFFAILLTRKWGCTVTHAFLLTMSIRLVQMLWNLSGVIFVFRGGYAAPKEVKIDDPDAPGLPPPSAVVL